MTRLLVILIAWLVAHAAMAAYPEKPIRVVLPYAAGGAGDVILRSIQQGMEKRLGQSLVIDYRTGGGGLIGVREVVKAAPDGYTLLFGPTNNFVIDQYVFKDIGYDPVQALVPITIVAETPYLLVINGATPARTYAEFSAYARANKGKLNYASPGQATIPQLSAHMLNDAMGADMTHVAFRGNAPALVALLAGDVHMLMHSYGPIASHLSAGKLRALAVGAPERLKALPEVPTAAEAGIPDRVIPPNWWALAVPRGTDREIVNRLGREARATLAEPDLQKRYVEQGFVPGGTPPAQVAERIRSEATAWKAVVERLGVKAD